MGNSTTISQQEFTRSLKQDYYTQQHPYYISKKSKQPYTLHKISSNTEGQLHKIVTTIQRYKTTKCESISYLTQYYHQNDIAYCSDQQTFYFLFYDHAKNTIKNQYIERRAHKYQFSEKEIRDILEVMLCAFREYYHSFGRIHQQYNLQNVCIQHKSRRIYVKDPWLSYGYYNSQANAFSSYPSPEKLSSSTNYYKKQQYDQFTSRLFSIGMFGLQLYNMNAMTDIYNFQTKEVYANKIQENLNSIQHSQLKIGLQTLLNLNNVKRNQIYGVWNISCQKIHQLQYQFKTGISKKQSSQKKMSNTNPNRPISNINQTQFTGSQQFQGIASYRQKISQQQINPLNKVIINDKSLSKVITPNYINSNSGQTVNIAKNQSIISTSIKKRVSNIAPTVFPTSLRKLYNKSSVQKTSIRPNDIINRQINASRVNISANNSYSRDKSNTSRQAIRCLDISKNRFDSRNSSRQNINISNNRSRQQRNRTISRERIISVPQQQHYQPQIHHHPYIQYQNQHRNQNVIKQTSIKPKIRTIHVQPSKYYKHSILARQSKQTPIVKKTPLINQNANKVKSIISNNNQSVTTYINALTESFQLNENNPNINRNVFDNKGRILDNKSNSLEKRPVSSMQNITKSLSYHKYSVPHYSKIEEEINESLAMSKRLMDEIENMKNIKKIEEEKQSKQKKRISPYMLSKFDKNSQNKQSQKPKKQQIYRPQFTIINFKTQQSKAQENSIRQSPKSGIDKSQENISIKIDTCNTPKHEYLNLMQSSGATLFSPNNLSRTQQMNNIEDLQKAFTKFANKFHDKQDTQQNLKNKVNQASNIKQQQTTQSKSCQQLVQKIKNNETQQKTSIQKQQQKYINNDQPISQTQVKQNLENQILINELTEQIDKQNSENHYKRKHNSTIVQEMNQETPENSDISQQGQQQYIVQYYDTGSRYQGFKANNMRNGWGKFFYEDGGHYEGQWKNNKMHGWGKLFYDGGRLAYQGYWKQDQFHGFGKVFNDNPVQLKSAFNYTNFDLLQDYWIYYEGALVSDTKEGRGKIRLTNGQVFEGDFHNDRIQGFGKFYTNDKNIIEGIWRDSRLIKVINSSN